jgi:hypothetical protein
VIAHPASGSFCSPQVKLTVPASTLNIRIPEGGNMASEMVALSKNGPIGTVTLQRPPANAMNIELTEQIALIFDGVANDPSIRSVILTGQDKSFCAGLIGRSLRG